MESNCHKKCVKIGFSPYRITGAIFYQDKSEPKFYLPAFVAFITRLNISEILMQEKLNSFNSAAIQYYCGDTV